MHAWLMEQCDRWRKKGLTMYMCCSWLCLKGCYYSKHRYFRLQKMVLVFILRCQVLTSKEPLLFVVPFPVNIKHRFLDLQRSSYQPILTIRNNNKHIPLHNLPLSVRPVIRQGDVSHRWDEEGCMLLSFHIWPAHAETSTVPFSVFNHSYCSNIKQPTGHN